jgi:hypothetical protein
MKYIFLAAHNNELIIIKDMDAFTAHFCYSKKQRQGKIDVVAPVIENTDDTVSPAQDYAIDDMPAPEEDDI